MLFAPNPQLDVIPKKTEAVSQIRKLNKPLDLLIKPEEEIKLKPFISYSF